MKLTVQVQLVVDAEQSRLLADTIRAANAACDWLAEQAWEKQIFRHFDLHNACYYACREAFPALSSQVVIRCMAKVADAYKLDRKKCRTFRPLGAIAYDCRLLSWKVEQSQVNIWTLNGRVRLPFLCGDRQRQLLQHRIGEADLVHRDGRFYLFATVDLPDTEERQVLDWLGVDLGVVEIASTSDGEHFGGAELNRRRIRNYRLRARLQSKGTRSAKRLLRKRRRKESRFSRDVNHCIAKKIVQVAERTERGIALENLTGVRQRIRARRDVRRSLHSWAFADLQAKIIYKAAMVGTPVALIDPRNTSRTCPACGHVAKNNRRSRDQFKCRACGFAAHADHNAAENIRRKALALGEAVENQPDAPSDVVAVSHASLEVANYSRRGQ